MAKRGRSRLESHSQGRKEIARGLIWLGKERRGRWEGQPTGRWGEAEARNSSLVSSVSLGLAFGSLVKTENMGVGSWHLVASCMFFFSCPWLPETMVKLEWPWEGNEGLMCTADEHKLLGRLRGSLTKSGHPLWDINPSLLTSKLRSSFPLPRE